MGDIAATRMATGGRSTAEILADVLRQAAVEARRRGLADLAAGIESAVGEAAAAAAACAAPHRRGQTPARPSRPEARA